MSCDTAKQCDYSIYVRLISFERRKCGFVLFANKFNKLNPSLNISLKRKREMTNRFLEGLLQKVSENFKDDRS